MTDRELLELAAKADGAFSNCPYGFHNVGLNRHVMDICCIGGLDDIRREIVVVAAEIGRNL